MDQTNITQKEKEDKYVDELLRKNYWFWRIQGDRMDRANMTQKEEEDKYVDELLRGNYWFWHIQWPAAGHPGDVQRTYRGQCAFHLQFLLPVCHWTRWTTNYSDRNKENT